MKVNVYDNDGKVIARVRYNQNLDRWDGNNYSSGSLGHHKGLTRLSDGRYVLIYGTQWEGGRDSAEVISAAQALQEILWSENEELLDEPQFAELKELYEKTMVKEEEER